ncbi:hypothetical protein [Accumulibacter sp.]|uniref:hypothetical protein n=1 Tax=Accumulibacter sp. TaxID=2053492 RepID=UPI002628D0DB|nr:hypothetical protein [Accumulibacter sp.]
MSEPLRDSPRDPKLSALYRQFSVAEPSAALDQRVLAAARAALADHRVPLRGSWWSRWRTSLALATTLVLSLTLALLHERQPAYRSTPPTSEPTLPEVRRDAPSDPLAERAGPTPATVSAVPAAALQKPSAASGKIAPSSPAGASENEAPAAARSTAESASPKQDERQVWPAAPAATSAEAKRESPWPAPVESTAGVKERGETARPTAARSSSVLRDTSPAPAESSVDQARSPAVWLDEIRALRRAGQIEEAARQLREFRRAHPDYPLPDDLRR